MCFHVLFEMILTSKTLIAYRTTKWSEACVNSLVSGKFFVSSEGLTTIWMVTLKWTLAF